MASKQYEITRKQSLLDACIQVYGTSKLLFQFAKDNGLQIDSVVSIGDSLTYNDSLGVPKVKKKLLRGADTVQNKIAFPTPTIFSDWFLPETSLLQQMFINLTSEGVGGFDPGEYWSSSEVDNIFANRVDFTIGTINTAGKTQLKRVRACRSFVSSIGAYNLRDIGPSGGLIFYIDGENYYEAAIADQSSNSVWSNVANGLAGALGTAIGDGLANTITIINQAGHVTSAAKLCNDLN